jgi:hypothetical protein
MQSPISPLQIEAKDKNLLLPQMYFQEKSNMIGTPSQYEVSSWISSKAARPSSEQVPMKTSANMHLPLKKQKDGLTGNHSQLFKSNKKNSSVLKSDIMNASSMRSTNPETLTFRDTSTDLDAVF